MKKLILILCLLVAVAAWAVDADFASNSTQQEQYRLAWNGPCRGCSIIARNISGSTAYLLVIDTNAAPASGAITVVPGVSVPSGSVASIVWPGGRPFSRGIVACFSTNEVGYGGTMTNGFFSVTLQIR